MPTSQNQAQDQIQLREDTKRKLDDLKLQVIPFPITN